MKYIKSLFASAALLLLAQLSFAAGTISVNDLAQKIDAGKAPMIIDVRSEDEYLAGHVPNAKLIPHDKIGDYTDSLAAQKDEPIVVYCKSGKRANAAVDALEKAGLKKISVLEGSFDAWQSAGKPVSKK